jgi:hypothetical protein
MARRVLDWRVAIQAIIGRRRAARPRARPAGISSISGGSPQRQKLSPLVDGINRRRLRSVAAQRARLYWPCGLSTGAEELGVLASERGPIYRPAPERHLLSGC